MSKVNRRKFIKGAVYSTIATIPVITVLDSLFIKKENEYISVNDLLVKEGFAKEYFGGKR